MVDDDGEVTTKATNYESDERLMNEKDVFDSKLSRFKNKCCHV
jgi:hypothetical protein